MSSSLTFIFFLVAPTEFISFSETVCFINSFHTDSNKVPPSLHLMSYLTNWVRHLFVKLVFKHGLWYGPILLNGSLFCDQRREPLSSEKDSSTVNCIYCPSVLSLPGSSSRRVNLPSRDPSSLRPYTPLVPSRYSVPTALTTPWCPLQSLSLSSRTRLVVPPKPQNEIWGTNV